MPGMPRTFPAVWLCAAALCAATVLAPPAEAKQRHPGPPAAKSIVKGEVAEPSYWAATVLILDRGRFECGGAVIAPTRVLTAAHCALVPATTLTVIAGRLRLADSGAGEVIGVSAAAVHPDYTSSGRHDLAVLTLSRPTSVAPMQLASAAEDAAATAPGARLRVAGWGARNPFGRHRAKVLQKTVETARVPERCARAYRPFFVAQSMICTLGRNIPRTPFHRAACVGDSGGPLVADLPAGPRLVGVVSFGGGFGIFPLCGFRKLPSVYARVADGLDFIRANLEP
jgi:secreted trypsin-like serine protease